MTNASSRHNCDVISQSIDQSETVIDPDASGSLSMRFALGGIAGVAGALLCVGLLWKPEPASALPSFARQTGQPCAACHTAFPELTPFGREFKLGGYTMGGGLPAAKAPPIAAMIQGPQFEHFGKNMDAPPTSETHTNNNVVLNQASLFYGGTVYGNLGAFVQGTYDGVGHSLALDNTDIRYADSAKLFGIDLIYGIDVNNNPTVQDVWNTTPAWGIPYIGSATGPGFGPPATMLEGAFAGTVAGAGVYTWWHDMVYAELTGYFSPSAGALNLLGQDPTSTAIDGVAPYWRVAIAPTIGDHSFMVGTFGMLANAIPGRVYGFGTDRVLDLGFDAQYQFIHEKHAVEAKLTHISEFAQYNSSFAQGATANPSGTLNTFRATAGYVYDNTYSFTASYSDVTGSNDAVLYGSSLTGSPNSSSLLFDIAYLPFSHGGPSFYPWLNARLGLSFTKYLTLNGATTNFDGLGHNAADNDTFLAYSWIMF